MQSTTGHLHEFFLQFSSAHSLSHVWLFVTPWTAAQQASLSISLSLSSVAQSCPTLCNPVDCSLPGSSVHGIFQAIVLEWIAISFSRGSFQPRDRTLVSRIVDRCFTVWTTPSPTPIACSNSCLLSRWCHPTISSSVVPFSHLQSFPISGSFQ